MDARRDLLLVLPSLLTLGLLVLHSMRTLPRPRALGFWAGAALFGIARGAAVRQVASLGLGGSFPYVIRDPLFPVAGVSLQEVAGWSIVLYLGWWAGSLRRTRLFAQVARAALFLAAASWAVEAAAIAAGWWRWSVPVSARSLSGVPFIGIVDWFFAALDFLLPFLLLSNPASRRHRWRWLSLAIFPAHFSAHLFATTPASWFPVPIVHLVHWSLLFGLIWLAARSNIEDRAFTDSVGPLARRIPWLALGIVATVIVYLEIVSLRRPSLLVTLVPFLGVPLLAGLPLEMPAAFGRSRRLLAGVLALLAAGAFGIHLAGARRQEELTRGLDGALAVRDAGRLEAAEAALDDLRRRHPESHVPSALLGEIRYRLERLEAARELFLEATRIQQSYADGFRYLAVIELRLRHDAAASAWASRGLEIEPDDPQLQYLAARAAGGTADLPSLRLEGIGPARGYALAALAFEVGDLASASRLMSSGVTLWPAEASFHRGRVRLALAANDRAAARAAAAAWLLNLPSDPEARVAVRALGPD